MPPAICTQAASGAVRDHAGTRRLVGMAQEVAAGAHGFATWLGSLLPAIWTFVFRLLRANGHVYVFQRDRPARDDVAGLRGTRFTVAEPPRLHGADLNAQLLGRFCIADAFEALLKWCRGRFSFHNRQWYTIR